jgi:hypothetical protein
MREGQPIHDTPLCAGRCLPGVAKKDLCYVEVSIGGMLSEAGCKCRRGS